MFLITGATGLQGGAVAAALVAAGAPVRALVRNPASRAAIALAARGIELAKGDFEDASSLLDAMAGVRGVFSVQRPPTDPGDPDSEIRAGRALIAAARRVGVHTFVHTSVARVGDQRNFIGWQEGRWWNAYWNSKSAVNDAVREAAFPAATILKPAYMMDNFATPRMVAVAFPKLKNGCIETQLDATTRLDMIAAEDVGHFAAAALQDPRRFNGMSIDLAADSLTMTEVAAILQDIKGVPVKAVFTSVAAALDAGANPELVRSYEWDDVEGYKVDIQALSTYWPLMTFREWATRHRGQIIVGGQSEA